MKMSKYTFLALIAALTVLSSCSNEDDFVDNQDLMIDLAIEVTTEDFQTDASATRASDNDNEFKTTLSDNDIIGIYVIDNGKVISSNVPYYKTGSSWQPQDKLAMYVKDGDANVTYLAYYPYRTAMDSKNIKSVDNLIENFEVSSTQNTHELYTASDLMVGNGSLDVSSKKLSFTLSHKLSLIVVDLKGERTHYYSDGYELYTEITGTSKVQIGNVTSPFQASDGSYRALVKPSTSVNLDVSYASNSKTITYNKNVNGVEGKYTRKMIYGGGVSSKTTMSIGDYFYSDGHVSNTLDGSKTCIGIVFSLPTGTCYNNKRLIVALNNAGTTSSFDQVSSIATSYDAAHPATSFWTVMSFDVMKFLTYGRVTTSAVNDEMTMKDKINRSITNVSGGSGLSGWYGEGRWAFNFDNGKWAWWWGVGYNPSGVNIRAILEF